MDKKTLNNEIIICRQSVRKARVAVIRRIIKNIRILKSCKNEALKAKKLKKAERLYNKIQIMKKLKDDDVTKFALVNKDLEKYLKDTSYELRENAMACLAKHPAVVKKVESIREQIPDWETGIPWLLESLGKKKRPIKKKEQPEKPVKKITNEAPKISEVPKLAKFKSKPTEKETVSKVIKSKEDSVQTSLEDIKPVEIASVEEEPQAPIKEEKVEDPFFIGKKVIAPKLLPEPPAKIDRKKFQWEASNSIFHAKPFKAKKEPRFSEKVKTPVVENEKLHPSWAAKKVQLIKPFEGKKIKFSD